MKRIVFVTGDKGGVGKSFASRILLDWYLSKETKVKAFDTDKTNSTLFRYLESLSKELPIEQLDTDDEATLDTLLSSIETAREDVFLIDCAARTMDRLIEWMKEVSFLELTKDAQVAVTIAFVMGPEKDCVAILKDMTEQFSSSVDYVVLKNLGRSDDFQIYDNSKVRQLLQGELGVIEITLPKLFSKTTLELDKRNLMFNLAQDEATLGLADRSRVKTFRNRAFHEVQRAESIWM